MHNFSMLKFGGGQHLTLLRRIAQKAVRHDTQSDCRRAEEVQDNNRCRRYHKCRYRCRFRISRRICENANGWLCKYPHRFKRNNCAVYKRKSLWRFHTCSAYRGRFLLCHACGGRNHLLTEVAA